MTLIALQDFLIAFSFSPSRHIRHRLTVCIMIKSSESRAMNGDTATELRNRHNSNRTIRTAPSLSVTAYLFSLSEPGTTHGCGLSRKEHPGGNSCGAGVRPAPGHWSPRDTVGVDRRRRGRSRRRHHPRGALQPTASCGFTTAGPRPPPSSTSGWSGDAFRAYGTAVTLSLCL
jgi:hypothetical protein